MPGRQSGGPRKDKPKPLPEELARAAIAREETAPGDRVRMTFRVVLPRTVAEALAAHAIREQKNLVTVVTEILETAYPRAKR